MNSTQDDDEFDDDVGSNKLLGFIFGNIDDSGDLDVDYLDEDAKDHLSALAGELGSSLNEIDLSASVPHGVYDSTDQEYKKAEDAVDYEDIEEQYVGPETEVANEFVFPSKGFEVSAVVLEPSRAIFGDEDYDEDENVVDISEAELQNELSVLHTETDVIGDADENIKTLDKQPDEVVEAPVEHQSAPLPVLCVDNGSVILKFSEIFGVHEPVKRRESITETSATQKSVKAGQLKSSDTAVIEDDEEQFLRGNHRVYAAKHLKHWLVNRSLVREGSDRERFDADSQVSMDSIQAEGVKKDHCLAAQPMKEDMEEYFSIAPQLISCEFYPLDQIDWEDMIMWGDYPTSDGIDIADSEPVRSQNALYPVAESSACWNTKRIESIPEGHVSHPQLMRLESKLLDTGRKCSDEKISKDYRGSDMIKHFGKFMFQNKEIREGTWLEGVIWDFQQPVSKSKLILDLDDPHMVFECMDDDYAKYCVHAGAMIITRSLKPQGGELPDVDVVMPSPGRRFNISNDKFYSNRKMYLQSRSHFRKRSSHGIKVLHSIPALKLQTMKIKLSNKDIANFHRPRASWYPHDNEIVVKEQGIMSTQGHMKILLKNFGGKGTKFIVSAEETVSSLKAKASRKLDFRSVEMVKIFYSGKELDDDKTLASQDVRPNSLLHLVRTKLHLLPRAQRLPGENKSLRPPGAFKKKSDLSAKDGHVFLMEYCEERPLLLGNAGMGARLCTYYQKSAPGDQAASQLCNGDSSLGTVLTLDSTDKSPFLGEIWPGSFQSCIETNMYRAPIFSHKVSSTDYLLIRSPKGKLSIRRIDRIHVVGQQEPHMEVMSPGTKALQSYHVNRLLVYVFREFRAMKKHGLDPRIRGDVISAMFPSISEPFIRKRLKHCADLQRRSSGEFYCVMRSGFRIPLEEELRRMVAPEDVCAFESMQAGLHRLKRMGITKLTHPTGLSSAMNQLPDEAVILAAASHIERELLITPWNLSSNFIACTGQDRENIERLEITGVGDPTGRGIGFSYVRVASKPPSSSASSKKKAVVCRGSATVTGTDADLRRLSMDAAREVLLKFNVPDEQINKLTRWHRIAMIRKLSSEQATSGVKVDPTALTKFARGQRMSFLQLQQQTREKVQEIWDRQVQSLSGLEGDEYGSDAEANSDLDSFAGDLENLLDAEEGDEDLETDVMNDKTDGVKGLKMRKHQSDAQAEEEIEDEAAEAAELRRMLLDDDETDHEKKKSAAQGVSVLVYGSQSKFGLTNADKIKRAISGKGQQPDRSHTSKESKDIPKEMSMILSKLKPKKNFEFDSKSLLPKKVKIMGSGVKIMKEKKSTREGFVCGACGQMGHMKTNKHCPKYRENVEPPADGKVAEKVGLKSSFADVLSSLSLPKSSTKRLVTKTAAKIAISDSCKGETPKAKLLPVKFKCASLEQVPEKVTFTPPQVKQSTVSETETGSLSASKFNKLVIHSNPRVEYSQTESHKPPSVVIRAPVEADREHVRKKIVIKRSKEPKDLVPRMKKVVELSSSGRPEKHDNLYSSSGSLRRKSKEERKFCDEEDSWRNVESQRVERLEEQERLEGIKRFEETLRRDREEEERQKATKRMKRKPDLWDDYFDSYSVRQGRASKRRSTHFGRYSSDYTPATKRRKGGEVGLANILEKIVDTLKDRHEISYLFLKPVTKKEAPDYLHIVKRPMDLSSIKEKVRRMEYRSREEFRHDVWQITFNAHQYNDGRNPGIPPLADQLLELCDYLLIEYDADLTEAEQWIESYDN